MKRNLTSRPVRMQLADRELSFEVRQLHAPHLIFRRARTVNTFPVFVIEIIRRLPSQTAWTDFVLKPIAYAALSRPSRSLHFSSSREHAIV